MALEAIVTYDGVVSTVPKVINGISKIVEFCDRILVRVPKNEKTRQSIEAKIKDIQTAVDDLESSGIQEFPRSCRERMHSFHVSLRKCMQTCEELKSKWLLKKVVQVDADSKEMQTLEKNLDSIKSDLHFILSRVIMEQNKELKREVSKIEANVIHPKVGVFHGACVGNKLLLPSRLHKPEVKEDSKANMIIH